MCSQCQRGLVLLVVYLYTTLQSKAGPVILCIVQSTSAMNPKASPTPTKTTYAELQLAYDTFNRLLFDGQLPDCMLTLQREKKTVVGYFSAERFSDLTGRRAHEIALNPSYFAIVPLVETFATLVHEMVHLWQHVHGNPGRGRYHNDEWANKMEAIGLMPSSTGRPGGRRVGDRMADYPLADGRFLWACEQLLTEDFKLSWYDRFTPHAPLDAGDHSAVRATLPAGAADAAMVIAANVGVSITTPAPARPISAGVEGDTSLTATLPYGSSKRSKYVCGCTPKPCAVWGKTALRLRCEVCDEVFVEQAGGGQ